MNARQRKRFAPDYEGKCDNCGQSPTVPVSGLCGPCHFGTHEAVNGGWWDNETQDFDMEFTLEALKVSMW